MSITIGHRHILSTFSNIPSGIDQAQGSNGYKAFYKAACQFSIAQSACDTASTVRRRHHLQIRLQHHLLETCDPIGSSTIELPPNATEEMG